MVKCHYSEIQIYLQFYLQLNSCADLEWKLTYVGSAESEEYDQILDTVCIGPVAPGQYSFVFHAYPPDVSKIPSDDIVGVTVILLTCSYREQIFTRIGYYVSNQYENETMMDEPPAVPQLDL
jgi:histone chaperone ASF1